MKSNEIARKKLMAGALSLALMTAFIPQTVFADASAQQAPKSLEANTIAIVKTTPAIASTTKAISIDQLTFKAFIKDMNLKSNTPSTTLKQAEKHFNEFKMASKAKQDKKAMASLNKMMQLLGKYQDIQALSATVITDTASVTNITATTAATAATATTPATPIQ